MKTATKLFKNLDNRFDKKVADIVSQQLPVGTIITRMRKPKEGEAIEDCIYEQFEITKYEDAYDIVSREKFGWQDKPPAIFMGLTVVDSGVLGAGLTTTHMMITDSLIEHADRKRKSPHVTFDIIVAIDIPRMKRVFNPDKKNSGTGNTGAYEWVSA